MDFRVALVVGPLRLVKLNWGKSCAISPSINKSLPREQKVEQFSETGQHKASGRRAAQLFISPLASRDSGLSANFAMSLV